MLVPCVSATVLVVACLLAPWPLNVLAAKPRFVQHPADNWALQDERLTLECKAEGVPTPSVTWWHDNRPLLFDGSTAAGWELRGSRLLCKKLTLQHAGYYWCNARNSDGEVQSRHANLKIDAPAAITTGPTNRTVTRGTKIHLECKAIGMPAPRIAWFMNNNVLIDETTGLPNVKSLLIINATVSANYTCVATNTVVKRGEVTTNITGYVTVVEPKQSIQGVCKPYSGSVCRPTMLSTYPPVFYNESLGANEGAVEQMLRDAWHDHDSDVTLTPRCRDLALRILCHLALPMCERTATQSRVLPLCREYCDVVRDMECVRSVWRGEVSSQLTRADLSRVVPLPDCASLPSLILQPPSSSSAVCSAPPNLFPVSAENDHSTVDCYTDDGQSYTGNEVHTSTGVSCVSWPQSVVVVFTELRNASNRCRNPGGWRKMPWCYTSNNGSWDYCPVKSCSEAKGSAGDAGPPHPIHLAQEGLTMLQALLLIGSSLLFVCMASLVACFAYHIVVRHRYRRHLRRHGRQSGSAADNVELTLIAPMSRSNRRLASLRRNGRGSDSIGASAPGDGDSTLDNGDSQLLGATVGGELPVRTLNLDPSLRPLECARTRVRLLRELGQGAFGRVYLASIAGLQVGSEEDALVAVKTLRADAADELVCDFEREASFVAQLEHANIIRLMGVCTGSEPLCLMYEYMNAGDLHDFLARSATSHFIARQRPLATSRHHHQSTSSDSEDSGRHPRITTEQQLSIGVQVARAMRYFANCNYVHRDLASRNCLVHIRTTSISGTVDGVSDMLIVKLADFGLARPVDQATLTYEGRELEAIPVRWLPFESSVFNIFSTASDVWSFGVLLWEVFSFAQLPYADLSHDEVLRHLGNGNHLSMPDNTPTEVYDVMVRCWHTVPEHRPTFDMLCSLLDDLYIKEQRGPRAGLS